jgi:ATP-dependent Lon protease
LQVYPIIQANYSIKMPKNSNKRSPKSDDGSSSDEGSDEEVEMMDQKEYRKFLNSLFPSKYLKNKIIEDEESEEESEEKKSSKSKSKSSGSKDKKNKDDKSEKNEKSSKKKEEKLDIIFTILPTKKKGEEFILDEEEEEEDDDDYDEEEDSDYSDDDSDEDDSENDSDDDDEEEEEESDEEEYEESEEEEEPKKKTPKKSSNKNNSAPPSPTSKSEDGNIYDKIDDFQKEISKKYKNDKDVLKSFQEFSKKLQKNKKKFDKKRKEKNLKKYLDLISNKNLISDIKFFKNTMSCDEQERVLEQLEEIKGMSTIDKPYRIQLLENKEIPNNFKAVALKKINAMKVIAEGGGEYSKLKNWVDSFMRIPFNKLSTLPVSKHDEPEKVHEYMERSQKILDDAVYGMKDAKMQLMQMVGQWVANPQSVGNAIAIKGPMGTGKTTLIKYGVSKLLNREFAFIPLGGATDSSYLEGHSYTYEGSTYGKIVDILIQCKTCNPVIYFDELDKVSDTPKGEEIIGILTHLTDTTQNDKFHDKYFSEIDFDMSKCLFIFSYNDESKINPILKDRMYNIETKGYDVKEKTIISKNYLMPKLERELDLETGSIVFDDEILKHIIETFTGEEKGVRNLKRCLEIIYSKVNLYKFMKPGSTLFGEKIVEDISYPYKITKDIVEKVITKKKEEENKASLPMYL